MSWLFKDPVVIMKEIISWLFKDPINCGLTQFDHAQSNCPKWFFSRKTPYKISMYLLAPFILQNFLKNLRADPELWGCAIFLDVKWTICPEQNIFGTSQYYFHLPIGPFHCAKFKRILTSDPELWGCAIFGPKMVHFSEWQFFGKPVNEPCSFHSCLSTCPSQILIYWWNIDD